MPSFLERNFRLPHFDPPPIAQKFDAAWLAVKKGMPGSFGNLDASVLAEALYHGRSYNIIKEYLSLGSSAEVTACLNRPACLSRPVPSLFTCIFYAVETNDQDIVRLLLENGADANAVGEDGIPVLAFAVLRAKRAVQNTTAVVMTLLAFKANPKVIPEELWGTFLTTPNPVVDKPRAYKAPAQWCTPALRPVLCKELHLSIRYALYRASTMGLPNQRFMQIATAFKITEIFKVPFYLVGQGAASKMITEDVFAHIASKSDFPFVMAFLGQSGHGKTEMARQMGKMLNVDIEVVNCAQMHSDIDMWGVAHGYKDHQTGSRLNNFLAEHDGKVCVVVLDEFDKTTQVIRNSLLVPCDAGEYIDRRNTNKVDCTKTIWVVATNAGDELISKFYKAKMAKLNDDERMTVPLTQLQRALRKELIRRFEAPFVGRINLIAPFFPFSDGETAVVFHKFFLDLFTELRRAINLHPDEKRYIAHLHLALEDDGNVCSEIGKAYYHEELGARSLQRAALDIKRKTVKEYCSVDALVEEKTNKGPLNRYAVKLPKDAEDANELVVSKAGVTAYEEPYCISKVPLKETEKPMTPPSSVSEEL